MRRFGRAGAVRGAVRERSPGRISRLGLFTGAVAGGVGLASPSPGQVRIEDLVVVVGASVDWHEGNFSAVTVPRIDSAESVASGAGHAQALGRIALLGAGRRRVFLTFDGSLHQYATAGYRFRNYAPRQHAGSVTAYYREQLGGGPLVLSASVSTSGVSDRPPLPLYLQPGYRKYAGSATYRRNVAGMDALAGASLENADYAAIVPQLDLLDHSAMKVWARAVPWAWTRSAVDLFGEYSYRSYSRQGGSGTAGDPFRTDHAVRAGASWRASWLDDDQRGLEGSATVDGTLNRSNSRRVEYNLLRASGWVSASLGGNTLFLEGQLSVKRYSRPFMHALVPGEEADNTSYVASRLTRRFGPTLNGSVRVRWTRAETSIGGAYFRRLGASFSLNYRPLR